MEKTTSRAIGLSLIGAILLTSALPVLAASTTQMKACKIAVLGQPKFRDFPMAAVSVRPGKKPNKVAFTVQWDGASGHGNCRVSQDGYVKEVNVKEFRAGRGGGNNYRDHDQYAEQDGFWRDKRGRWIDPDGEVCHSCTPENGFPSGKKQNSSKEIDGFYWDSHMGHWRDPDGEVCYSCTPENGFPDQN